MTPYTIVYSNNISIYKNEALSEVIPYGKLHTKEFAETRRKLHMHGLRELEDFYPPKQIFNQARHPVVKPTSFQSFIVDMACDSKILNGIFESPTGSGKTNVIAYIIFKANMPSIIIVPTVDLALQTKKRISTVFGFTEEEMESTVGVLGDGHKETGRPVLIATWQSLQDEHLLRLVLSYGYCFLFQDEAHRASAEVLNTIIEQFKIKKKFGFTATCYRTKIHQDEKIKNQLGEILHSVDVEHLYDIGFIIRPKIIKVDIPFSSSIEDGIRMYYEQKIKLSKSYRYKALDLIKKEPYLKDTYLKFKNYSEIIDSPSDEDIYYLTQALCRQRTKNINMKKKNILSSSLGKDVVEKKLKELESIQIGLAKKGIDLYRPRLNMIIDYSLGYFSREGEAGAILFNTIEAGEYVALHMKEAGFDNILLINGNVKNKSELIEQISSGDNKNFIAISTVHLLGEGTDSKRLKNIISASPTYPPYSGIERGEQIGGRVVRSDENNVYKTPQYTIFNDKSTKGYVKDQKEKMFVILEEAFHPAWEHRPIDKVKGNLFVDKNEIEISSKGIING